MRMFLGIPLPAVVREGLRAEVTKLRPVMPGVRWVADANYHITTLFLGDIDRREAARVEGLMESVRIGAGEARLSCLAQLPPKGAPRVVIATLDVDGETICRRIHSFFSGVLSEYGDNRSYSPHVTLGRVRRGMRVSMPAEGNLETTQKFFLENIVLFESVLHPHGAVYRPVRSVSLQH